MKLYLSHTSPFARLVIITALRAGKKDMQLQFVNPWENPAELETVNPLSQVPCLVADDGNVINHSLIISMFLDDSIVRGGSAAHLAGLAFSVMEQFTKYFTLKHRAGDFKHEHPHIPRARLALARSLPQLPDLKVESEEWSQYLLAIVLGFVARDPELFEAYVSAHNKVALKQFEEKPLMKKTHMSRLESLPKNISEL